MRRATRPSKRSALPVPVPVPVPLPVPVPVPVPVLVPVPVPVPLPVPVLVPLYPYPNQACLRGPRSEARARRGVKARQRPARGGLPG